jgi:hypothetical protein
MVKLTIAVAALVAVSLSGTRLRAQTEEFASVDETVVVQDAQDQTAQVQAAAPIAAVSTGPTMEAASLSPRLNRSAALETHAMRKPSGGSGVGLMILGGAALVTGLIIGDDAGTVIAVGGAIIGLYGLYVFLGRPSGMEHGEAAHSQRIGLGYKLNTN